MSTKHSAHRAIIHGHFFRIYISGASCSSADCLLCGRTRELDPPVSENVLLLANLAQLNVCSFSSPPSGVGRLWPTGSRSLVHLDTPVACGCGLTMTPYQQLELPASAR
jgi:hypothetical protein